jgi:hypothetical protein
MTGQKGGLFRGNGRLHDKDGIRLIGMPLLLRKVKGLGWEQLSAIIMEMCKLSEALLI